jgi:hypothetical protein
MTNKGEASVAGGIARAKAMNSEERKASASLAAVARWNPGIKRATHDGDLQIGDLIIPCAVLEDGTRVLTQSGLLRAIGRSERPSGEKYDENDGFAPVPTFLRTKSLKSFISKDFSDSSEPIAFIPKHGGKALGFRAELLPMVCDLFLEAREAGALPPNQMATAKKCEILVRSLAKVGIVALVDEATGYQEIRDKHALRALLDEYLSKELSAWAKRFPDDFYKEIFRLRKWEWRGMRVNRPQCVANYTTNVVYDRLAPGIVEELERRNPVQENGGRKAKHHQWLTSDVGHPALSQHIHAVTGLMRANGSWDSFMRQLDRAFPKKGDTLQLPLSD